jgi:hypothetical protein
VNKKRQIFRAACLVSMVIFALPSAACRKKRIPPPSSDLRMSDSYSPRQLIAGFYKLEQNQWRWTARRFAVVLKPPPGSEQTGATLQLTLFIPESQIEKLGPMTLSADVGEVSLSSETFTEGGSLSYRRQIPPALIGSNLLPVVFRFDKALAPFQTDGRELAAVVSEVSLEPRKKPSGNAEEPTATGDAK